MRVKVALCSHSDLTSKANSQDVHRNHNFSLNLQCAVKRSLVKNRPEPRTSNPKDDGTLRPHMLPPQARILDDGTVVVCVVEGRGLRSLLLLLLLPLLLARTPPRMQMSGAYPDLPLQIFSRLLPALFFIALYLTGAKNALCGFWADLASTVCSH